jgi:hypothetical protein
VRCMSVSGWGEQRPPKETEGSASLDVKPNEDFTGRKISRWEKSSNFPDFIEAWGRRPFYVTGAAGTAATAGLFAWLGPAASTPWLLGGLMGVYWYQGIRDVGQESHTIKKNYPVLGNIRYILETIRPEIRQYFVEGDLEVRASSTYRSSGIRSIIDESCYLRKAVETKGRTHPWHLFLCRAPRPKVMFSLSAWHFAGGPLQPSRADDRVPTCQDGVGLDALRHAVASVPRRLRIRHALDVAGGDARGEECGARAHWGRQP